MPPEAVIQLQARLASVTGLPEDVSENVIHIGSDDPIDLVQVETACELFRDFYNVVPTGGGLAVGARISESVSRAADKCSIVAYATSGLDGSVPFGSPDFTLPFTLTAAQVGSGLPEEVAIVVSYQGDLTNVPVSETNPSPPPATIRPQQRRRGRLYFGPLQSSAGTELSLQFRPNQQIQDELGEAFRDLAQGINALTNGMYLGVWSKADADVHQVVSGYVDDAWDTQRRRGLAATERTPFTI